MVVWRNLLLTKILVEYSKLKLGIFPKKKTGNNAPDDKLKLNTHNKLNTFRKIFDYIYNYDFVRVKTNVCNKEVWELF